ncbi:TPA: sigma 54-interacting transcriptional regulator [Escherichia albertii]|nr:sigma 54-interacting transcriptional regulator [Escherichia albertii]
MNNFPPFRLTLITPYQTLSALVMRLAAEYSCAVHTLEAVLDEVYQISEQCLGQQPEVLLSRGGTAEYLRSVVQDVPVVAIKTAPLDLLCALQPFVHRIRHVAFFNFGESMPGVADIARALDMQIDEYVFHTQEEMQSQLLISRQLGAEMALGGQLTVRLAGAVQFPCVLLETGEHSVRQLLQEAANIAGVRRKLSARSARLNTVLNNIAQGIIVTDERDGISMINPAAERLLNVDATGTLGKPISEVIPLSRVPQVRQSGQREQGELLETAGRTLVADRVPILDDGYCLGVVCTFADSGRIQRAEQRLRHQLRNKGFTARYSFDDVLTCSPAMLAVKSLAKTYAAANATVLIQGETGTGKELFAQGIHLASRRADGPFVAINCAAIPEALLESELFGYEEGAFTGARRSGKAGMFELAHQGTLFLDEVGELPLLLQARLLRVLQEREVVRLGGTQVIPVDVRILCATHRDLDQCVSVGTFRQDLLYRLNVLSLFIPPLRERRSDILHLARHFLGQQQIEKHRVNHVLEAVGAQLERYNWPGNLRELQNITERMALFVTFEPQTDWRQRLSMVWSPAAQGKDNAVLPLTLQGEFASLKEMVRDLEQQIIHYYLQRNNDDQTRVAQLLGISRMSLWRRMQDGHSETSCEQ